MFLQFSEDFGIADVDPAAFGFAAGDFPAAEAYYDAAITIPLYPALAHAEQDRVVEALTELLG